MGLILVPGQHQSAGTPFMDLVRDEEQLRRVFASIVATIDRSFREDATRYGQEHAKRVRTDTEMKRRADILGRWFRVMRGELDWGVARTLDELPRALRAELDGGTYTPPEARSLWAAGGSN